MQLNLLESDIYDAMGALVQALGGPKVVGCKLRPDKSADDAQKWVNNCLDRSRREKFAPEDLMVMLRAARHANNHDAKHFIDDFAGYHRTQPKSIQEEKECLMRAIKANQESLQNQFKELGKLDERERSGW